MIFTFFIHFIFHFHAHKKLHNFKNVLKIMLFFFDLAYSTKIKQDLFFSSEPYLVKISHFLLNLSQDKLKEAHTNGQ